MVAAIQQILDKGLSEPETRSELIGLARVLGLSRTDVEAIAKEIEVQNIRTEDLEADAKQFQRLVSFRNQDLNLHKIFPKPLAQALLSKAESSRLDPIRLVQNLLPAGGTMLGNHVRIIAKYGATPHDHWLECPAFWCADVSAPSSGKSDAQRAVFSPLKYIQSQEFARVEEAKKQLAQLEEKWKLLSKEEKLDRIGTEDDPEYFKKNNIDNLRRYLWDEVTTEALFKLISKQPENSGSCLLKDELQGLFLGMDQFKTGRGNGIQQLLTAWGGPLTGSVDRVDESKSYRFNNQTLNLCGSIQPDVARKSLDVSADPDGFTSRVLFGMSKLPDNFDEWSDVQVDLFGCIRGLLEGLEQMQGVLEYSPSAYKLQKTYWATLKKGYRHYLESNPAYAYFLGKQNSYVHRFALLLHCIEHYYEPKPNFNVVCIGTVQKAIALSQYYCGQFRLLQAISAKPDEPQLDGLLYLVWEKVKSMGKFSTRQLCHFARRQKWRGEKMSGAAALDILKTIASCGLGELKDKVLHFKASTPPTPPTPPDPGEQQQLYESVQNEPEPQVFVESTEPGTTSPELVEPMAESDECGQVWSQCPHPESEEESDFEASVVRCGQDRDTCSEPPQQQQEDVVMGENLEQIEQTSSTPPDWVEDVEEVQAEVMEPEENSGVAEVAEVPEIVVGSRVLWDNCPAHWESWAPYIVESIDENGMVKLDIARPDYLVHISELGLA